MELKLRNYLSVTKNVSNGKFSEASPSLFLVPTYTKMPLPTKNSINKVGQNDFVCSNAKLGPLNGWE